jgi:hypothetical protein
VTKKAQIVPKTLQIGGDNKSANECQNCRKVTVCKRIRDVTFNAGFYAGKIQ